MSTPDPYRGLPPLIPPRGTTRRPDLMMQHVRPATTPSVPTVNPAVTPAVPPAVPTVTPDESVQPQKLLNQAIISQFFITLTDLVQRAAEAALNSQTFKSGNKDMCVLPLGIPGVTRSSQPFCFQAAALGYQTLEYDPGAVCFVGGAALHAYGLALHPVFKRNILENLKTTDIDAVWWPKTRVLKQSHKAIGNMEYVAYRPLVSTASYRKDLSVEMFKQAREYVVVSSSPYIESLATAVAQQMLILAQEFLHLYMPILNALIGQYMPHVSDTPTISTNSEHIRMPGVWNVSCTLHIGDIQFQIVELAIHDGASSQKSMTLEDKRTDYVYQHVGSDVTHPENWDNVYIRLGRMYRSVPVLKRFMLQQWLALTNRLHMFWMTRNTGNIPKIQTHYLRIRALYDMLTLMQMYRTSGMPAFFNEVVGDQYRELEYFMYNIVRSNWFQQAEWIAACPWDSARCQMTAENKSLLAELCRTQKVLQHELCASRGGKHKTRRRRMKRSASIA